MSGAPELGAFVITYRRPEQVTVAVRSLLAQSRPPRQIVVVDNGASEDTARRLRGLGDARVSHLSMPENLGPAGAAAEGLAWCADRGYPWVYWGDDDDPPATADTLERLGRLIRDGGPRLAAVGTVGTLWDWRVGRTRRLADDRLVGAPQVDAIGGNQSLILRTAAVAEAGGPQRELFFGWEEIELCLRLRRAGYELRVDGELMRECRRRAGRLGLEVRPSPGRRHAAGDLWRRYYAVRNYIYLMHRTFGRPDLARREVGRAVVRAVLSWRHGPGYGRSFTAVQMRGVRDGLAGRMGRTLSPPRTA